MSEFYWLNPFMERPDPEPILREAFKWEDNGIFVALASVAEESQITLPWEDEDAETLDLAYFGNHSGGKFCAPVVKLLLQTESFVDENGQLNSDGTEKLASILLRKYYTNWTSLWRTNVASYDPIHNYNMYEERDLSTTDDNVETTEGTLAKTGTDIFGRGTTETTTHGMTNETVTSRFGLNTETNAVKPSDKVNSTDGGTTVVANTGTDAETRDLLDTTDMSVTEDNEGTEHEEIHRYGNIGVTTTQKLLQEERELWLWNYFDQIFADLDRELALAYHDPCRV